MPRVEVLITTRGDRPSLRQAVLSALAQDAPDLRVTVCLDDPDPSETIYGLAEVGSQGARLILTPRKFGRGMAVRIWYLQRDDAAEVVKFLDDDDWMAPSCVATMLEPLEADPAAPFALCEMLVLYAPHGKVLRSRIQPPELKPGVGIGQVMVRTAAARGFPYRDVPDFEYFWLKHMEGRPGSQFVTVPHALYVYNAYRGNAQRGPFADV